MGAWFPVGARRLWFVLLMLPFAAGCSIADASIWQFPWERRASYQREFTLPPQDTRYSQFPRTPPVDKETYLKHRRKGLFDDWLMPATVPTRPRDFPGAAQ